MFLISKHFKALQNNPEPSRPTKKLLQIGFERGNLFSHPYRVICNSKRFMDIISGTVFENHSKSLSLKHYERTFMSNSVTR